AAKASIVAITQIAMDHEEYLGNTLASIAAEKAAIIRPGVHAVIARQQPEALDVLLRRCEETGVTPLFTDAHAPERFRLGLRGRHQFENAAVAIRVAELLRARGFDIPDKAIATGL